jgi:hypothetical protein
MYPIPQINPNERIKQQNPTLTRTHKFKKSKRNVKSSKTMDKRGMNDQM